MTPSTRAPAHAGASVSAETGARAQPQRDAQPHLLTRTARLLQFAARYRHLGGFGAAAARAGAGDAAAFAADIEALGPAFIKIGQALSIRPDLLPPAYIEALEHLQDGTAPVPFATIRATVEQELGVRLHNAFVDFETAPLAAASLAQVHGAVLRDGRPVAVKVQRPGIADEVKADFAILGRIAHAADRLTEQGRRVQFAKWIAEMAATVDEELDYRREADNLRLFREHLRAYATLQVPEPIDDFSTRRVLTMDRIDGTKVGAGIALRRLDQPLEAWAGDLVRAYLDQIFLHGLVHADPHPGNVMLTARGLALVDLGMVARLGPRMREALLALFAAAVDGDGDEVARQLAELGERFEFFDEHEWARSCGRLITRFATQGGGTQFGAGQLMIELTRRSVETGLRPPPEIALLGRTLLALEGVAGLLAPQLPMRLIVSEHLQSVMAGRVREQMSLHALGRELVEVNHLAREMPQQLRSILDLLARNRLQVRISGLEESRLLENIQKIANRVATGLIAAALLLSAALSLRVNAGPRLFGYPVIALVLFALAIALAFGLVASSWFSDRRVSRYRPRER